jgi:hypothetical protein
MSGTLTAIKTGINALAVGSAVNLTSAAYNSASQLSNQYQGSYTFPDDLLNGNKFFMAFNFVQYKKRQISDTAKLISSGGTLRLPLPNQLHDNTSVNWGSENLGPALGSIVDNIASGLNSSQNSSFDTLKSNINNLASNVIGDLADSAGGAALNALSGNQAGKGLSAISGLAVNPFMTMLFKNTTFKTHNFSWTLAPSNPNESENLMNIIKTIKYHMLPGLNPNASNILFNYPDLVQISIYPEDTYLYKFKPCAITSFNVNYAPANPSFFKTKNAPTMATLNIGLTEVELWTKNDYLNTPLNSTQNTISPQVIPNNGGVVS